MDIKEYIRERLDPQIDWYDKKSMKAQRWYKATQIIEIILASAIPLLTGYSKYSFWLPVIIGIFGALIAILNPSQNYINFMKIGFNIDLLANY